MLLLKIADGADCQFSCSLSSRGTVPQTWDFSKLCFTWSRRRNRQTQAVQELCGRFLRCGWMPTSTLSHRTWSRGQSYQRELSVVLCVLTKRWDASALWFEGWYFTAIYIKKKYSTLPSQYKRYRYMYQSHVMNTRTKPLSITESTHRRRKVR